MSNGRRRAPRSAFDRMARVRRFSGVGTYDYGPAAVITEDFGSIGQFVLESTKSQIETARKARERLAAAQKEAQDAQDYPLTGIADVDKATMTIASQYRNALRNNRDKIGKRYDDEGKETEDRKGRLYTISDFVAYKNNVINNSKIWKGHPELIEKTLKRYQDDKTIDPITPEAYAQTVGLVTNPGGKYEIYVSDQPGREGDIIIGGENPDGTRVEYDLKTLAVNSVEEIQVFNPNNAIKELQTIYAGKVKDFNINGKPYTTAEVLGNPLLLTQSIKGQTKQFEQAKKDYLNEFAEDKQKVVSYLRQLGTDVEYDHMAYSDLSDQEKKDFDKIYLNEKGRFVVSDALKKKAKNKFGSRIDAGFGIEKTQGVTRLQKPDTGGTTGKPGDDLTVTSLSRTSAAGDILTIDQSTGEQIPYDNSQIGIAFARASDPEFNNPDTNKKFGSQGTDYTIGQPFIDTATLKKMSADMIRRNQDLFQKDPITGEQKIKDYGYGRMGNYGIIYDTTTLESQAKAGNVDIEGFGIGANLIKEEINRLGITATSGGKGGEVAPVFNGISGISFTFNRKVPNFDYNSLEAIQGFDIDEKMPKNILGFRLLGTVTDSTLKERKIASTDPGLIEDEMSGEITELQASEYATSEANYETTSDLVPESKIPQLVELISRRQPNFETIFRKHLGTANVSAVKALYLAVKESQMLTTPLNPQ